MKLDFANAHPEEYLRNRIPRETPLAIGMLTVLLMHLVFHLSRRATMLMLFGMRCMLFAQGHDRDIINQMPIDPRSLVNRFDLDPRCSSLLQCPVCYALYPYSDTTAPAIGEIDRCSYKPTPTSPPCDVPLWEERRSGGRTFLAPRRKYVHQSLKEWVGRLLTRPGVPELFRESCNRPAATAMEDIWDAPVLRNFKDEDGQSFFRGRGDEIRLAFSLNADGFNPFHMLEAKQSVSCTAIYMIILNFPPHLRFLFRNMYLAGVIPGPGKPSLDQINHALSLLVVELLEFWRGVYYTIIFASQFGCLTKGALIPLVCDMLSARQLLGLGSATSTWFCTLCLLTIQDIENLDKSTWPAWDLVTQIKQAEMWRDCESEEDRDTCFKACGVRWSVLLDLPYWNPLQFSVPDSMHLDYLGLVQSHCRKILRINISVDGGEGTAIQPAKDVSRPSDQVLLQWLTVIRDSPDTASLRQSLLGSNGCPKAVLWHICVDNNLRSAGERKQLVKNITDWVSEKHIQEICALTSRTQRRRVDPVSIKLPARTASQHQEASDDGDSESTMSESSLNASNPQIQEKVEKANKAFVEYKIGEQSLGNLLAPVLKAMCHSRGLDSRGTKAEIAARLITWVYSIRSCYLWPS